MQKSEIPPNSFFFVREDSPDIVSHVAIGVTSIKTSNINLVKRVWCTGSYSIVT